MQQVERKRTGPVYFGGISCGFFSGGLSSGFFSPAVRIVALQGDAGFPAGNSAAWSFSRNSYQSDLPSTGM